MAMQNPSPSPNAIIAVLRERLPPDLHPLLAPLASLLADLLAGKMTPNEAEDRLSTIAVGTIEGSKGISIGPGASSVVLEIGDITINLSEGLRHPPATAPFMASDLPADFVARPDEFERIVAHVLGNSSAPVAISAALRGAGGFGKTTLATAVCHHVRDHFPDGVLWVTLGEKPGPADLVGRMADLVERLTGSRPGYSSLDAATSALAETLGERRLLLVIDDAWDAAHLKPFLQGGPHTVRLITTRNRDTLPDDVRPVDVDAMRQAEAVDLLAAGLPHPEPHLPTLRALAARLGEWPLLLKIVNGVLREQIGAGAFLAEALTYVREGLDEEGITVFDTETAEGRNRAVNRTLTVSLATLSTKEQQHFAELAIFPEDVAIPLATLQRYWGISTFKVKQICGRFATRSLLLANDQSTSTIRLHDVVRAYLAGQHANELVDWHEMLLAAYRPASGDWADLPQEETHLWVHLTAHLVGAHFDGELIATVKDLRYLARKTIFVSISAAEADLAACLTYIAHDAALYALARQVGKCAHLLARCQSYADCATTLAAHLWEDRDLRSQCEQLVLHLPRPALLPQHPLADTSPGLLRYFTEHTSGVNSGVFSPDGQLVLSASNDRTLILWEVSSGQICHTLKGHTAAVNSGVFSPDGQLVLSASSDGVLILWEVSSGQIRHILKGHTAGVRSGVFSPDSQIVLSASSDGVLILWEVSSGQIRHILKGHTAGVRSGVFSPDGQLVLSASNDRTLILWEVGSGQARHILKGHTAAVNSGIFSPDGHLVLSASDNRALILWEVGSGQARHTLKGYTAGVRSEVFSPDGQLVLSTFDDKALVLWEVGSGQVRHAFKGHSTGIRSEVFSPDGQLVLSTSDDRTIILWEVGSGQACHILKGHTAGVRSGVFSPNGQFVLSTSGDRALILWEISSGQLRHTLKGHAAAVNSGVFSPDGHLVLSASNDGTLILWDVSSGQIHHTLKSHTNVVWSGVFSPDGQFVLSASNDGTLILWNVNSGQVCHTLKGHTATVNSGVFSPDGHLVLSASNDGTLILWDVSSGQVCHTLKGHTAAVNSGAFSPDGQFVLSTSDDRTLILWEVSSGQIRHILKGHTAAVNSGVFNPDGHLVLSISGDRTLILWEVGSGQIHHILKGHTAGVRSGAFSPDGHLVLSASSDGALILWGVGSGQRLTSLNLGHPLVFCAFSPDSRTIVTGDTAGRVLFLSLRTAEMV